MVQSPSGVQEKASDKILQIDCIILFAIVLIFLWLMALWWMLSLPVRVITQLFRSITKPRPAS